MSSGELPRMLVVDDEVENAEYLRRMFRKDFSIEVATSGEEGLERLQKESFDVIITDQMMPGLSGTELLERSLTLAPDAVRILVTGFPNLQSAMSSINEGRAYRFFTKPLVRQELRDAVDEAVVRQRSSELQERQAQELVDENAALLGRIGMLESRIEEQVQMRVGEALRELEQLRTESPYDEETGLLTRASIMERLEQEISRCERFGIVCAFAILRLEGYAALCARDDGGAAALDRISSLLGLSSRRYHSSGRYAEDKFALVMPHASAANARRRVQRMLEAVAAPPADPGDEPVESLALRAGVAVFPKDADDAEGLAVKAELNLAGPGPTDETF